MRGNEETSPGTDRAAPGGETEDAAGGGPVSDELEELVDGLKRERDEYLALAQRAKADFENFRKRAARDAAEAERRGKASLARALLPSIDNLERALLSAGIESGDGDTAPAEAISEEVSAKEALARGLALIHGELQSTLARAGVEAYDPTGEPFDPAAHEAISTRPADDGVAAGMVVETLERGYRLEGQVLRPARVIVGE